MCGFIFVAIIISKLLTSFSQLVDDLSEFLFENVDVSEDERSIESNDRHLGSSCLAISSYFTEIRLSFIDYTEIVKTGPRFR